MANQAKKEEIIPKPRGSFNNTRNSKDKLLFKNAIPRIDIDPIVKKNSRELSIHSMKIKDNRLFENSRNKVMAGNNTGHRSA